MNCPNPHTFLAFELDWEFTCQVRNCKHKDCHCKFQLEMADAKVIAVKVNILFFFK